MTDQELILSTRNRKMTAIRNDKMSKATQAEDLMTFTLLGWPIGVAVFAFFASLFTRIGECNGVQQILWEIAADLLLGLFCGVVTIVAVFFITASIDFPESRPEDTMTKVILVNIVTIAIIAFTVTKIA